MYSEIRWRMDSRDDGTYEVRLFNDRATSIRTFTHYPSEEEIGTALAMFERFSK